MSDVNFYKPAPQGWECPKCNRVYSPSTPMCFSCGDNDKTEQGFNTNIA